MFLLSRVFSRHFLLTLLTIGLLANTTIAAPSDNTTNSIANIYLNKDWQFLNQNDQTIHLSQFKGKPVILVFWATWCPYCKKLLPGIEALKQKYGAKLVTLAVNIKEDWQPKTYWHNHQYSFDTLLNGDELADVYDIQGTPGVMFIAPDGQVLNISYFSDPNDPILEKFAQYYIKP